MKNKIKLTAGDIIFNILNYLFFSIFTLICILPFYYLFINTISDNELAKRGLITLWPSGLHINNYIQVFKLRGLGQAALISIGRTVIGTALTVFASAFVGYLVTKQEMWGRKFWYRYIIITMYFSAGLVPWYMNMVALHLTNNFLAYIIPGIVAPFNIILVKTYIESIPPSLEESAAMDGAGIIRIFVNIIWPLITPILATIAIFCAVGAWNSFTDTLFLMTDEKFFTLQYVLYRYLNEANYLASIMRSGTNTGMVSAAQQLSARTIQMTISMVVVIPILLVYPFLQKYFVKGIMIGAVKG
ncbi:MAG: carbohydrate ABC transporter permease [Clostridiales bacterium]|jgi:ABC-type glycerol-3-phosphate transport system permease component|nr:carbohydrate ABC transporter permease [Clostridiales bacterium]